MDRQSCFKQLMSDIKADLVDYQALQTLLEEQFQAALTHHAAALTQVAADIQTLAETLNQRRITREKLARQLCGGKPSMSQVFLLLKGATRTTCEAWWAELETRVRHCKSLNERNGYIMRTQQDIMQRILHGKEPDTYAPV